MKFSLATLITTSLFVASSLAADFKVTYYHEPNFNDEAGFQQGSIETGGRLGRPNANLTDIQSIKADDWLKVVVYSGYAYGGSSLTFLGSQSSVDIPFTIHSIKLYNTQQ
ncbi:unnamed protein product [Cunninghamella blakesleeana]